MIDLKRLQAQLLQECREDQPIGLWAVLWVVRYTLNGDTYPERELDKADPQEVRRLSLELVRRLLESGSVQAGSYEGGEFVPWDLPATEALRRIEAEWDALGREPNMGENVWFTASQMPAKTPA